MKLLSKLLLITFLLILTTTATTAYACGCGIYIPSEGDVSVSQERALVRWDGQREDIVLSLGVLGGSPEAAIILPVPTPAQVQLADPDLFAELAEMTKPLVREEIEWTFGLGSGSREGAPGAAGSGVAVLSRQNVGPFDVANLAASDSTELQTWLDENGFQLDPSVIALMQPYVDDAWTFVAVRLQPEQASQELSGDLAPLWISFDTPELVYPMRASANADVPQTLYLYILADHRVEKQNAFGTSEVAYADWVEPAALASGSALAPLANRRYFLTKFIDTVNPAQVDSDFLFNFAPQDDTFRQVTIRRVQQDAAGIVFLACLAFGAIGTVLIILLALVFTRRRAASSHAA